MKQKETFLIRQMVELTGLSEFTIRGWETRYKAFKPNRGDTGRREYSKGDVERALLLRELLKRGHKISKVASLNSQKLLGLFEQTEGASSESSNDEVSQQVSDALEFMALQKWAELKSVVSSYPEQDIPCLVHQFILPVLKKMSEGVQHGLVSISQEHVVSSVIKEKIYSALTKLESKKSKRVLHSKARFVLAAPEGDYHETGLLLAHLLIRSFGFTSLNVGAHTPARDLSETALRFNASHVLIVSTISSVKGARNQFLSYVSEVQKNIGESVQIIVAGHQVTISANDSGSRVVSMNSFPELESHLEVIGGRR